MARSGGRPIRLLQFTKSFHIGGTEVQVLELLRRLPERFPDRYEVEAVVLDAEGLLLEKVWQLGYLPESFSLKGTFVSPNTAVQIARLASWLRKKRIDLVHVHDFYATLIAVPAAKLAGAKVVVGRLDLLHWHGPLRSAVLAKLTRGADHVIANAEAVKQFCMEREGLPEEKISVVRNGIDLPLFDSRFCGPLDAPVPEVGSDPLAVHVANMSHEVKRQEDFLHAMKKVRAAGFPLQAFFIGDGCRRPGLQALAGELGLTGAAHFLGFRKDGPAIQARATFGVLSSNKEGLSNAVIEGMAARLPMVVTDVGGNPELVRAGERGWVVPAEQPEALAEAVLALLRSPEKARQMGAAGRTFVERELTLEQMIANHDQVYQRVSGADPVLLASAA